MWRRSSRAASRFPRTVFSVSTPEQVAHVATHDQRVVIESNQRVEPLKGAFWFTQIVLREELCEGAQPNLFLQWHNRNNGSGELIRLGGLLETQGALLLCLKPRHDSQQFVLESDCDPALAAGGPRRVHELINGPTMQFTALGLQVALRFETSRVDL